MSVPGSATVLVVGAGLAGLAAAAAARAEGADVVVLERASEPGGATVQSAGWIWRYRDRQAARAGAPHGDEAVQARIVQQLDGDIEWLQRIGVRLLATDTERPHTVGARVDPRQAVSALVTHVGEEAVQLRAQVREARTAPGGGTSLLVRRGLPGALADLAEEWLEADAVVFAGGGYAADLDRIAAEAGVGSAARERWVLRATAAGDGSSMDVATSRGGVRVPATGESLVRLVPGEAAAEAPGMHIAFGELLLEGARLYDAHGTPIERAAHDWSGAQAAWRLARSTGAGRLELDRADLRRRTHAGQVEDIVRAAIAAGAPSGRRGNGIWIAVQAGITQSRCGLRVRPDGALFHVPRRVRRFRPRTLEPLPGLFAAGADAACAGMGGTASGLAQALVLGRAAGRAAGARALSEANE